MQQLKQSDWDKLIEHSINRWNMTPETAVENMVSVIRHAVYDPGLALIISTTGLLKMAPYLSPLTATWVDTCEKNSKEWLKRYRLIEHHCVHKTENEEQSCRCILKQIGPLFADSDNLFQTGSALVAQLPAEAQDEAYDMLLRALRRLSRVSTELADDNLGWLHDYINKMTY